MERKWLGQIAIEYDGVNQLHRLGLAMPTLAISHGTKKLGQWNSNLRVLSLSDHLIANHSWEIVCEILKHELAHQYVTDIMQINGSMPHGEEFQEACLKVGVHPDFRGAKGRLPKFLKPKDDAALSSVMLKIEKLLALGESPNEHEAASAMEKANSLIIKHNIQQVESCDLDYDCVQIVLGKKRIPTWKSHIIKIVCSHFFVRSVVLRSFCAKTGEQQKVVELIGKIDNLAIAEHVFCFLEYQVVALWEKYQKENRAPAKHKNSFLLGVLTGFAQKMEASDAAMQDRVYGSQSESSICVMVLAEDVHLKQFMKERFPVLKKRKSGRGIRVDGDSFASGEREGKRLTIHKAVNQSDGNKGALLTAA